ncbi:hypothetical protein CsSME_00019529 [Camellia sinensis var. sinensis]
MMSRSYCCYHVSNANAVYYPSSSLATGPDHDVVWSARTLLTLERVLYINVHYQPPYLPDVVFFALLGSSSSVWFPTPRLKVRIELLS